MEFYLPQLVNLLLHGLESRANLERFLLEKCARSMHLAFHLYWLLTSYMEDELHNPYIQSLRAACEMAVVNGSSAANSPQEGADKVARSELFSGVVALVDRIVRISNSLRFVQHAQRQTALQERLDEAWAQLVCKSAFIPLWPANTRRFTLARLPPGRGLVLNSRDRVPFMVFFEILWAVESPPAQDGKTQQWADQAADIIRIMDESHAAIGGDESDTNLAAGAGEMDPDMEKDASTGIITTLQHDDARLPPPSPRALIAKESPLARQSNWDLLSLIVKYGDDCRQERLAVQLLAQMRRIFVAASLPIYLHPHVVLVVGSRAALIETISRVKSIDQCKASEPHIVAHFRARYGDPSSAAFEMAQRNFVESLAGYSIACYLLAIKDRHNGNILLDADGHLIHIDFGFVLGLSPGGIGVESAPFKLVPEWLSLMGGEEGDLFHYFKALLVKGFMELQKHSDSVLVIIEMMMCYQAGVKQPIQCLRAGDAVIAGVRKRFESLGKTEGEVVTSVNRLVSQSLNATSTRIYDHFQWMQNRIRYKSE